MITGLPAASTRIAGCLLGVAKSTEQARFSEWERRRAASGEQIASNWVAGQASAAHAWSGVDESCEYSRRIREARESRD